jgi:hypothetical protein
MMPDVIDALARLKEREHFTGDGDLVFCSTVGARRSLRAPSPLLRRP